MTNESTKSPTPVRNRVFVCYSQADQRWLDALLTQLQPQRRDEALDVFVGEEIALGARWEQEIFAALAQARIAILLISSSFLASTFISKVELPALFAAAEKGLLTIIPLWIAPSMVPDALLGYRGANEPAVTLSEMSEQQAARHLVTLAQSVRQIMKSEAGAAVNPPLDESPDDSEVPALRLRRSMTETPEHRGLMLSIGLGVLLLALLGSGLFFGWRLLGQGHMIWWLLALAAFSLLATAVCAGIGGSIGVWQGRGSRLIGPPAVFLIIFTSLIGATRLIGGEVVKIQGQVIGVRGSERRPLPGVQLFLASCPDALNVRTAVTDDKGRFSIEPVSTSCESPPFKLQYIFNNKHGEIDAPKNFGIKIEIAEPEPSLLGMPKPEPPRLAPKPIELPHVRQLAELRVLGDEGDPIEIMSHQSIVFRGRLQRNGSSPEVKAVLPLGNYAVHCGSGKWKRAPVTKEGRNHVICN